MPNTLGSRAGCAAKDVDEEICKSKTLTHTHREGKGVEQNEKAQKENEKKEESRKIAKRFLCLFCKIKSNVLVLWGEICFVCRIRHTCQDTILPYYNTT